MTRRIFAALLTVLMASVLFSCAALSRKPVTVRIMTWNLHHCEGKDGMYNVRRIAEFMQANEADIILCQEVDREFSDRSGMDRQPDMLAEMLGFPYYYYGPNIGNTYGNLILSRYPLIKAENIALPNPDNKEPRGVIVSTIDVKGTRIKVLDTHLSAFEPKNRIEQIAFLRTLVKELSGPIVFGADFNTKPSEQLKPLLDDGVLFATRNAVLNKKESIDDILVSPDLLPRVVGGDVAETMASDHLVYYIDIMLKGNPGN